MLDGGVAWREAVLAQLTFEASSVAAATGPGEAAVDDDRLARARRRRRAIAAALVSAVALAALLIVILRPQPKAAARVASTLGCQIEAGTQRRAGPAPGAPKLAAIGDTLAFTATVAEAGLWIYGGDRLVLRCPGADGCAVSAIAGGRQITASVRADAALTYTALLFEGRGLAPQGSLLTDADRFQDQIAQTSAIDVR